jgi:hypothetical protein
MNVANLLPPFIWPAIRGSEENGQSFGTIFTSLSSKADLISGVIVGAENGTVRWIESLLRDSNRMYGNQTGKPQKQKVCLVILLYPSCPTRAEHLSKLLLSCNANDGGNVDLEIRVLTADKLFGEDCEKPSLPPTIIQAFNTRDRSSTFAISSIGDAGHDPLLTSSFNMVLHADPELTLSWRDWFNYTFAISKELTADLCSIPYLAPARGTIAAMQSWQEYQSLFTKQAELIAVQVLDETTGENKLQINGKPVTPFDDGKLTLDSLALLFQKVYRNGALVTIDEKSRLKPIAVPVKAMLLDQDAEKAIGAVTRKQSFTLHVLDKKADKSIEKCRLIGDVLELLTISLSNGNRWIPESAKEILNNELDHRHKEGLNLLLSSIGVTEVPNSPATRSLLQDYIKRKADLLCKDLDLMYQELGKGRHVPPDKVLLILDNAVSRLEMALSKKITPSVIFNQVLAPDLSSKAPDSNWAQPLEMLYQTASSIRNCMIDLYFTRAFKGLSFEPVHFLPAIDIFSDHIIKEPNKKRAKRELAELEFIYTSDDETNKDKCKLIYAIICNQERD